MISASTCDPSSRRANPGRPVPCKWDGQGHPVLGVAPSICVGDPTHRGVASVVEPHVAGNPKAWSTLIAAVELAYGWKRLAALTAAEKVVIGRKEPDAERAFRKPVVHGPRDADFWFERPPVSANADEPVWVVLSARRHDAEARPERRACRALRKLLRRPRGPAQDVDGKAKGGHRRARTDIRNLVRQLHFRQHWRDYRAVQHQWMRCSQARQQLARNPTRVYRSSP